MPPGKAIAKGAAAAKSADAKEEYDGPKPEAKMKGLFWEKTTNATGTFWASEEEPSVGANILGNATSALQDLFGQAPKVTKPAATPASQTQTTTLTNDNAQYGSYVGAEAAGDAVAVAGTRKPVQQPRRTSAHIPEGNLRLIVGARAQNIEITVKKLNLSPDDLKTLVETCDTAALGVDKVQMIFFVHVLVALTHVCFRLNCCHFYFLSQMKKMCCIRISPVENRLILSEQQTGDEIFVPVICPPHLDNLSGHFVLLCRFQDSVQRLLSVACDALVPLESKKLHFKSLAWIVVSHNLINPKP